MQPIHCAAQEGHEDAVVMLISDFHVKPNAINDVINNTDFHLLDSVISY